MKFERDVSLSRPFLTFSVPRSTRSGTHFQLGRWKRGRGGGRSNVTVWRGLVLIPTESGAVIGKAPGRNEFGFPS